MNAHRAKNKDSMYSSPIHESRKLKQARPRGQYVDLLRKNACYSLKPVYYITVRIKSQAFFGNLGKQSGGSKIFSSRREIHAVSDTVRLRP